jgi:AraC family transcriptional regulator, dual regulator of chb operon
MTILRIEDLLGRDEAFHAARTGYSGAGSASPHGHDFAEVFWIDGGTAALRERRGVAALGRGSLRFVLPGDVHGFACIEGRPFSICNVAFRREAMGGLARLHPEFFRRDRAKRAFSLGEAGLRALASSFSELFRGPNDLLSLERFVLHAMCAARDSMARSAPALPDWLAEAAEALAADPGEGRDLVSGLARACGKSREHVSRLVKAATGETASAWLRGLQAERAASRLCESEESVLDAALACGFSSLATFYRVFKAAKGASPAEYRRRARMAVEGR